jgi:hypothetical protein
MSAQHRQSRKASRKIAAPRQDFALNLSAKRCLCNTVGGRIGRIVEGCAAYRCAVTAARSRALTMTNFARSSLALVLRAFFGGAKSCALVNIFMICPPMVSWWLADDDQILSLIAAISWLSNPGLGSKIQPAVMAKAPPPGGAGLRGTLRHSARKVFRLPQQSNSGRRDFGSAEKERPHAQGPAAHARFGRSVARRSSAEL